LHQRKAGQIFSIGMCSNEHSNAWVDAARSRRSPSFTKLLGAFVDADHSFNPTSVFRPQPLPSGASAALLSRATNTRIE
jgi:hypothetical protein